MHEPIAEEESLQRLLRETSTKLYEEIAPEYETLQLEKVHYHTPEVMAKALAIRQPPTGGPWLDLGAGTGLVGKQLHLLGVNTPLIAMDLSPSMMERISDNYVGAVVGDATRPWPFRAETFTRVFSAGLFEFVSSPLPVLRAARAALKPNGLLLLTYAAHHGAEALTLKHSFMHHHPNLIRHDLEQEGFTLLNALLFDAYTHTKGWVQHDLVIARRCGG